MFFELRGKEVCGGLLDEFGCLIFQGFVLINLV